MIRTCARATLVAWLSLSALPSLASAQATVDGIRLAPATPGAVRFTVEVPEPVVTALPTAGLQRVDLEGYGPSAQPGEAALPTRVLFVAVPPEGDVRLTAVGSLTDVRAGLELAGPAYVERGAEDLEPATPRPSVAAALARAQRATPARLLDVSWLRDQRVARVAIEPAIWDPLTRQLRVDRRIDIELSVTPTAPAPAREADGVFESIYRSSLVNYEQGRAWRRRAPGPSGDGLRSARVLGVTQPPDTSVYVGRLWVKIGVSQPGFYKVDFSSVRNLSLFGNVTTTPIDSLRLFTWPGLPVLPEQSYCDSCGYREVAFGVIDAGTQGVFGTNQDALYFYAMGASDWADRYDPSQPDTNFINHPYEKLNYYYLTVATAEQPVGGTPKRIQAITRPPVPGSGATDVTTFRDRSHQEQDVEYWPDVTAQTSTLLWEKFFWRSLNTGGAFTTTVDLPGAVTTEPARFRMRAWGLNRFCAPFINDHLLDVTINDITFGRRGFDGFTASTRAGQTWDTTAVFIRTTGNALTLRVPGETFSNCRNRIDRSALAWYDLFYTRQLRALSDQLTFTSPDAPGAFRYAISGFTKPVPPRLFDITDPYEPAEVLGGTYAAAGAEWTLAFEETQSSKRQYHVLSDSALVLARLLPSDVRDAPATSLQNLRSRTRGADYLVLYYDEFKAAAESLATWRTQHLPFTDRPAPYRTATVPISALYDQFSGGRTDAAAIRNFLRAAFFNWQQRPTFVTFLGDASYDFKNIQGRAGPGQPGALLPTYEYGFDVRVLRQFATDDWFLNVDDPNLVVPDFLSGRIPATDASTARDIVLSKVLAYERSAPLGEYRDEVTLIADDNLQGSNCDPLGWVHIQQTTQLDTASTPTHVDRNYVYLNTFESGAGGTKPGARTAVKDAINSGTTVLNYVGHGSPFKISDEGVFLDSDAGTLVNGTKLPVFVAASCDVGKFNDPSVTSLGERLLTTSGGGAIAVISATELAFSDQNSRLNRFLYDGLFQRTTLQVGQDTLVGTGGFHVPISAALLSAKIRSGEDIFTLTNNQKYQVLGDAATRLNLPRLWADVELTDGLGAPISEIRRGQTVRFRGTVKSRPGGPQVDMSGVAALLIEDAAPTNRTTPEAACFSSNYSQPYRFSAGPMYRGDVTLQNGQFSGQFIVPLDAVGGPIGRARAYVRGRVAGEGADTDGVGDTRMQVSSGVAPGGDETGPQITLSFTGGATSVRPDATLRIDLFDASGIMITAHSLQNSIVVTLDDNTTSRVDVTSTFRYAADSYQSGTASFTLPGLAPGPHRIKVCAADNLASGIASVLHRSCATLAFEVVDTPKLEVTRAYLFPNPAASTGPGAGGQFVVDAPGDSVNSLVRIYTNSGRLIRTLRSFGGLGQVQLSWDGRDEEGDPLAQGTYLFRVFVNGREPDGTSSARQKAVSQGKFVILNR